jgi:hypothetical protein
MVRETSVETYRQIHEGGLLSKMRFEVYHVLFKYGPATAGEVSRWLSRTGVPSGGGRAGPGNVSARLIELRAHGVAKEVGERECGVTKRSVILWDVTSNLPVSLPKVPPRPSPAVIRRALADYDAALDESPFFKPSRDLSTLIAWLRAKYVARNN